MKKIKILNKLRKNKRGAILSIMLVVITVIVLTYAFIQLSASQRIDKEIGVNQLEIITKVQEGEKALIFLDSAAKMSAYQSAYDLQQTGGLSSESECGTYNDFRMWNSEEQDCMPTKQRITESMQEVFTTNIIARMSSHPTVDFAGNLNNAAITRGELAATLGRSTTGDQLNNDGISRRAITGLETGTKVLIYVNEGLAWQEFRIQSNRISQDVGGRIYPANNGQTILDGINNHEQISFLFLAGHGSTTDFLKPGNAGIRIQRDALPTWVSVDKLAEILAPKLTDNAIISLAGCSAGASPGEGSGGSGNMGPGGENGLAGKLRDALIQHNAPRGVEIRAHSTAGHLSANPYARVFRLQDGVGSPGNSVCDETWGENAHETRLFEWIRAFRGENAHNWMAGQEAVIAEETTNE